MKTNPLFRTSISIRWLAPASCLVLAAGCFSSPTTPNVATLKCETNQDCPIGYECKAKGQPGGCCKPGALTCPVIVVIDGASPEAFPLDQGTTIETSAETGGGDGVGAPLGDRPWASTRPPAAPAARLGCSTRVALAVLAARRPAPPAAPS
jgi:hypothetical protein